jgi:hypothetical protein
LAKPNYSFEKRQRELAKKKKQDEKNARKREARGNGVSPAADDAGADAAATPPAAPEAPPATPAAPAPRIHRRAPSAERTGE